MKILLVAINAKYIHSNLAVLCLEAYAKNKMAEESRLKRESELNKKCENGENIAVKTEIETVEYTINQQAEDILMDLYERDADMVCFSCYIWNMNMVSAIAKEFSKIRKEVPIWLGGPEVSFDAKELLERMPFITGVMRGEGEVTFYELLLAVRDLFAAREEENIHSDLTQETQEKPEEAKNLKEVQEHEDAESLLRNVKGITYRLDGKIYDNPDRMPMDLSDVPFVYEDLSKFENKIIYYETSRGCPFSCSYCLSSIDKKVRFRKLELVKKELQFFLDNRVPQVKFVDRTFNCSHKHAQEIWTYLIEHDNGVTNFHFEIAADLLNEEELKLMSQMRPGLIQLEIGVQSTNLDTIQEIHRLMDLSKLRGIVDRIHAMRNIHQHLDLIVGLPYENFESFQKSYDDVYSMKPDQLQLGFLKVLKGSYMATQQNNYGLVHTELPPYEVLYTDWISYDDVVKLKGVEEMTEVYYNSHQFDRTLAEIENELGSGSSMFAFFSLLWDFYKSNELHKLSHKRSSRYEIFAEMLGKWRPEKRELFRELLTLDYYLRENAKSRPDFAGEDVTDKRFIRQFYEEEAQKREYLPALIEYDKNQLRKMTHLEHFPLLGQTILFDYSKRDFVTHEARTLRICKD